jgi:hypothetical protein
MAMHRLLGSALPALLLVTALAACGDETASDDAGADPSSEPSVTMSSPGGTGGVDTGEPGDSTGSVDFDLVDTITVTAAGGALMPIAIPLSDEASVAGFNAQFESDDMVQQVKDAVAGTDVPDGQALYAAVVAIGCDAPTDVAVTDVGAGLVITAGKVPSPMQECFAPMTTVALVLAAAA